jgi:uroporphyrinogen-III synthase
MMPIVTIRPQAGALSTVARGQASGVEICAFAMFVVEPVAWDAPDPDGIDALLLGSANAIRLAGAGLQGFVGKPVYAVGQSTAAAAREMGFPVAGAGSGGLQSVVEAIGASPLRLLRLAGRRHLPLELPANLCVETREVYDVCTAPMPRDLTELLRQGAVVMLHSAAAAEHFRSECERLDLDLSRIHLATLGPRIAQAAGTGWGASCSANRPDAGALLALAQDMCH